MKPFNSAEFLLKAAERDAKEASKFVDKDEETFVDNSLRSVDKAIAALNHMLERINTMRKLVDERIEEIRNKSDNQ